MNIPKILHYCFGMSEDFGGKPWSLVHYVCLRSAIEHIRPEAVCFYYEYEPQTAWWQLTEPLITKIQMEAPREIHGRPLHSAAHRADVVRLVALLERGGIYLDADVMVHRDFDPLLQQSVVLGQEGPDGQFGVANAVILSSPRSLFLTRWLDQYKWFRGGKSHLEPFWNEHSVQLPSFMSRLFPNESTVLNHLAFYWPLWIDEHVSWIFKSNTPIDLSQSFATHLWESKAWEVLQGLTPGQVRSMDTNFARWAEPYLRDLPDDFGAPETSSTTHNTNTRKAAFQQTYAQKLWGHDGRSQFFSGIGSRGQASAAYVDSIVEELHALRTQLDRPLTIVDIGCGDFSIGADIMQRLPDTYVGCDIVPELIEHNISRYGNDKIQFKNLDVVSDDLPDADVYLVRQVFQHLPNADIQRILNKLRTPALVYVTEGQPRQAVGAINPDKEVGHNIRFDWRTGKGRGVELDQPPYNLSIRPICQAELPTEIIKTFQILWQ